MEGRVYVEENQDSNCLKSGTGPVIVLYRAGLGAAV